MQENHSHEPEEDIYSRVLRAGRRTYFFDVRSTSAGDYYLTITESKKLEGEGYRKHKLYLYKEDFQYFQEILDDVTGFIVDAKGKTVISDTHDPDFKPEPRNQEYNSYSNGNGSTSLNFEDL